MFDLLNKTYNNSKLLYQYKNKVDHYKNKYIRYIHPDFIKVLDQKGKLIAFAITMPSFSRAQKVNGNSFFKYLA